MQKNANPNPFFIKFLKIVFNTGIFNIVFITFCGNFDKSLDLNFAYILGTPKKIVGLQNFKFSTNESSVSAKNIFPPFWGLFRNQICKFLGPAATGVMEGCRRSKCENFRI